MQIGELFLNLGIKGTDKTVGALTGVKKGLSETASLSLEAKAGIVGAMYALEQLFATSGRAGTNLANFNALTGESVQTLQKYQYAGRQVGITNEEVASSFKGLQSQLTQAAFLGKGGPAGLARVSGILKENFSQKDIQNFAAHPELLIQKLQEYAQKEKNVGLRNETLKTFGLGEGFISSLTRNAYRPDVLNKAPTYSDKEVGQLDKANIAWSNLGNKIEMAVGHFNAKHGGALVSDISKIVDQVVKLTNAFVVLLEKLKLFQGIGKVFEGWTKIFTGITQSVTAVSKDKNGILSGLLTEGKNIGGGAVDAVKGALMSASDLLPKNPLGHDSIAPKMNSLPGSSQQQNNQVTINNNFQHEGKDHKRTGDSMKQSIQQAYRQMSAQTQGT